MTTALYDQEQLGDLETPVFTQLLNDRNDLLNFILDGDFEVPEWENPAMLELAFQVDAAHYELAPSQVPTVEQIEADIDAGIVPVVIEAKHRKSGDDEESQPEPEEEKKAAFASADNRDS
jgi:hypothetical protein